MYRSIGSPDGSRSTRSRRSRGDAGFTLLEVLIAFAILAVMIVPILQTLGGSLGGTARARTFAEGAMLARSKLTEIAGAKKLEEGETSGEFEGLPFRWRATVERDDSEVTLPDGTVVGEPDAAKHARSSRSSGRSSSTRSGFGSGSSGFGSSGRSGSIGSGSGFGSSSRSTGFGQSKGSVSGTPNLGTTGFADAGGILNNRAGEEEVESDVATTLIPYRVTVTVEWGEGRSGAALSVSTERLGGETTLDAGSEQ